MLSEAQIDRFSRHILLREVGGVGQEKLLASCVRIAKLDEPGRACALWLARSGVGALCLPDDRAPAPESDASGLLLARDAGRPMIDAVRERLRFHSPELALRDEWNVDADDRSALEVVRSIVAA